MRTMVDVALLGESVSSFVCVSACFSSFPLLPFFPSLVLWGVSRWAKSDSFLPVRYCTVNNCLIITPFQTHPVLGAIHPFVPAVYVRNMDSVYLDLYFSKNK